jgi:hypothetical protein
MIGIADDAIQRAETVPVRCHRSGHGTKHIGKLR